EGWSSPQGMRSPAHDAAATSTVSREFASPTTLPSLLEAWSAGHLLIAQPPAMISATSRTAPVPRRRKDPNMADAPTTPQEDLAVLVEGKSDEEITAAVAAQD